MAPGTLLDVVLAVALLAVAVRGARRGALAQLGAFAGTALGLVVGAAVAPRLAGRVVGEEGTTLGLVVLGLLLVAILLGQTLGFAVGGRLRTVARSAGAGSADRAAGVGVGVAALLLVVWLLGSALVQGPVPALAAEIRDSRIVDAVGRTLPPAPDLFSRVGSYLQSQQFPQVFSGLGADAVAPPVAPPADAAVAAAQAAGQHSTVQVLGTGCGGISAGSGFVTRSGVVVTNAHVVAGSTAVEVRDATGTTPAQVLLFDPALDLAVLGAPQLQAPPLGFRGTPAGRGDEGATLGYPGGAVAQVARPAAVRERRQAVGRDIYGRGQVDRDVLTLDAGVAQGDSGGPFVTADGLVAGVVFAASAGQPGVGFALTAADVAPLVEQAVAQGAAVATGECRL